MTSGITELIEQFERDYGVKIQYGVRSNRQDCLCSVYMRRGRFHMRAEELDLPLETSELKKILYDLYCRILDTERMEVYKHWRRSDA